MKFIKELLGLVIVCFFGNGYAMENGQDNIKEVLNMRDMIVKATTIIEARDRTIEKPIFKSVAEQDSYNRYETKEALCVIGQAYSSWISIACDANARPEHIQAANSLLDKAIELRAKIGDDLDF